MKRTANPLDAIDYRNDAILFDPDRDRRAELFITFNRRDSNFSATLYDSTSGDLKYKIGSNSIQLPAPKKSQLEVTSNQPWIRGGTVSYNLQIRCKSGTRCSFGDANGNARANISIVDTNDDGTPEYEVRQILDTERTDLMVNRRSERTLSPDSGVIWPYIGSKSDHGFVRPSGSAPPPIQINWSTGKIVTVAEFVTSRGDEDNYFVYSKGKKISKEGVNEPSFEFPFSFYDLAGDSDGNPELQVRIVAYPKGAQSGLGLYPSRLPFDLTFSRYSWDQTNDGRWNYKIGVIGTNGYQDVQTVGEYKLRMPGYQRVPEWVNSHEWHAASFVAVENGTGGSEGIYAGGYQTPELRRQVLGIDATTQPLMNDPETGYRIEFSSEYDSKPRVYYSPVDQTLHLYDLEYGTWNRTGASEVRYRNVDDDPYVDVWVSDQRREQRLIAESDHLIYTEGDTISFKRTSVEHAKFVTSPPATTEEWKRLGDRLPGESAETLDLRERFREYGGERFKITDAEFTGYAPTDEGFYIYATISSESQVQGNSSKTLPNANQVVFVFDDQEPIGIHQATSPSLSVTNATPDNVPITPLERNTISVTVQNDGWQTAQNVTVALTDEDEEITNSTVSIVGKQKKTIELQWWPKQEYTEATIKIRLDGETVTEQELDSTPEHRMAPSLLTRFAISNQSVPLTLGIGLAVSLGLLVTARRVLR